MIRKDCQEQQGSSSEQGSSSDQAITCTVAVVKDWRPIIIIEIKREISVKWSLKTIVYLSTLFDHCVFMNIKIHDNES